MLLLLTGCKKHYILLPGGVKVERRDVCNNDNCGVAGDLRNVSGDNPRTAGVTPDGEPNVAEFLGNKLDQTYHPPQYCGDLLTTEQVALAKNGGDRYELQINFTGKDKSALKASLKAQLEGKLSSTAEAKAAVVAAVDRTVDEEATGKYVGVLQSYTMNGGEAERRRAACRAAHGHGAFVVSLAVLQFSSEAQKDLKRKLIANLKLQAEGKAELKAAIFGADGSLEAGLERESELVIKTAAASLNRILILGFTSF